jgi:hypothetical protein
MVNLIVIISFLYAGTGIVAAFGYVPTIIDLIKNKKGANRESYIIWTIASGVTFLYSLLVIKDLLLEIITGLNFVSCAIILLLTLRIKYMKK